jgi:hypothetical protein
MGHSNHLCALCEETQANPDGFLTLKDFHRAVNAEMQAIKRLRPID